MHRFFIEKKDLDEGRAIIKDDDFNHIKNVLRMEKGNKLEIACDGKVYLGSIAEIDDGYVIVDKLQLKDSYKEDIVVNLFQGLAKGSKMDLIIQKGTEVGVSNFYGIDTSRTVVKIKGDKKKENRLKRWNKIAEEAAKQSKRNRVPEFKDIINFDSMLDILKDERVIIVPYEEEKNTAIGNVLRDIKKKEKEDINIIIGPEGGFEEEEIDSIKGIGGRSVSLGSKILRTETAGLVTSTIVFYELSGGEVI